MFRRGEEKNIIFNVFAERETFELSPAGWIEFRH